MPSFFPYSIEPANQVSILEASNGSPKVEQTEAQRQPVNDNTQGPVANQDIRMVPQIEGVNEVIFKNHSIYPIYFPI